jgi:3-oxoacyl-[acyl-carrier protein] reductase/pteridine reductase
VLNAEPLAGKTALVTGGARRIGRAIALALAEAGADVAISYRSSHAEAAQTSAEIAALGRRAVVLECDVRSEPSVRAAVAAVRAEFGRLDLLVNNAAIFASAALESLTLEQWDAAFETNARGPFLVAREALPHLRAARGRIVNIGSLGGFHPWAGHAHYCASKAALHMLTEAMAKAFAPEVSVNCVAPGWIEFPSAIEIPNSAEIPNSIEMNEAIASYAPESLSGKVGSQTEASVPHSSQSESERRAELQSIRFAAKTPMGRNGSAADVAQAVLFFATGPHFITGQTLAVDGGLGLS